MPVSSPPDLPSDPGFGLYVHWPFCAAKCPYCDFNSHVRRHAPDQEAYGRALVREMVHMAAMDPGRPLRSIFFGGGTPSLMDPHVVGRVLEAAEGLWGFEEGIEITLEANPTSSEAERFAGYRAAGVNRLSIGVQSLREADLKALGRLHTVQEAIRTIGLARATFPRLSFDLIYARPGQSLEDWAQELRQAIDLAADHLSLYQLTIEEGTPFFDLHAAGRLCVPGDDEAADLYALTQEVTAAAGLPAYEVSNHAAPGMASRHNLVYWRAGSYAGIGPGAHGRLQADGRRLALSTLKRPEDWLAAVCAQGHGIEARETVSAHDQGAEFLMMGLRLEEGVDLARFAQLNGTALPRDRITPLEADGLVRLSGDRLKATDQGRPVLNALLRSLLA